MVVLEGESGWVQTLNSFSGFVWLAQILQTFTFCGELLRMNGVAQDGSHKNAGSSIFIFGLTLPLGWSPPTPVDC